ncbi:MAG: YegP family protein [Gammaproteobacteria bacterium]
MNGYFELKETAPGAFMFNLKAGNNEVILTSQSYVARQSATDGIASVQANAGADAHYERKTSKAGEPFFVLKATNGQVIGNSEMYSSTDAMEGGVASVKANGASTTIKDLIAAS